MQKEFTRAFILKTGKGCYDSAQALALIGNAETITLDTVLRMDISIIDKFWFVNNVCKLITKQRLLLALECAKVSLKIYEAQYPNDKRIADCIKATEQFLNGSITIEELDVFKDAAALAADAAYATYDAAADAATLAANATPYAAHAACSVPVAASDAALAAALASAAYAAYYAAAVYAAGYDAAAAAANAAYAAYADAAYAASAADTAAALAAAALAADAEHIEKIHTNNLLQILIDFCNNQD